MYYLKQKDGTRRYLTKQEEQLVRELGQKEYNIQVLESAKKELDLLTGFINKYPKYTYEDIYGRLSEARRELVHPATLTDAMFVESWCQEEYITKGISGFAAEFYTDRGERVRSKTEILIANALNRHGVPYRYESPLHLDRYGTVHPDFTVLNVRERKEMYWEHLGMMGNVEYVKNAMERIAAYEQNGILPGDRLILTFETDENPVSSKNIESKIRQYLLGK